MFIASSGKTTLHMAAVDEDDDIIIRETLSCKHFFGVHRPSSHHRWRASGRAGCILPGPLVPHLRTPKLVNVYQRRRGSARGSRKKTGQHCCCPLLCALCGAALQKPRTACVSAMARLADPEREGLGSGIL